MADGIRYLEDALGRYFPNTPLQKCVTHLKRNMLNRVRHGDKGELANDLREVFRTGDRSYTPELAWQAWRSLCVKWGKDYRSIKRMDFPREVLILITSGSEKKVMSGTEKEC